MKLNKATFKGEFRTETGEYVGELHRVAKNQIVIAKGVAFSRNQYEWISAPFPTSDFKLTGQTNYGYYTIKEYTAS